MGLPEYHTSGDHPLASSWEELGAGVAALSGLAELCRRAIVQGPQPVTPADLSAEASALLFATRNRGILEVKGANTAFEAPERILAVYVEQDADTVLMFRSREQPEITVRFFDGLRELCAAGLVVHQIYRDFSLSRQGFDIARAIDPASVEPLLKLATPLGTHY